MKLVFTSTESETDFNTVIETVRDISPFMRNLVDRLMKDMEKEKELCMAKIWKDQLIGVLRAVRVLEWSGAALIGDECPISKGLDAFIWCNLE